VCGRLIQRARPPQRLADLDQTEHREILAPAVRRVRRIKGEGKGERFAVSLGLVGVAPTSPARSLIGAGTEIWFPAGAETVSVLPPMCVAADPPSVVPGFVAVPTQISTVPMGLHSLSLRPRRVLVKIAYLVAALVAGALLTGAPQAAGDSKVIRLTSVLVSEQHPNDRTIIIRNNDLINGKKVGHDTLTCKVVAQSKVSCSIAVVFAAGKLNGTFVQSFSASGGKGAITGGTGKYAGAKGTFTFRNLNSEGTRTGVVVTLR
jgi:hypothetical protein